MTDLVANYHTHSFRSHHGEGDIEEYVEHAISIGIKTLGFSEHAPYKYLSSYRSWWHLQPDEMDGYVYAVLKAREKYADRIKILLGLEAEYYPETFELLIRDLKQYPIEYMVLGQHAFKNEYDSISTHRSVEQPELLKEYVDTCIKGLETGLFSYLAHPDILTYAGDEALYEEEMGRLCLYCAKNGFPLEVNLKGIKEGRHYPSKHFFTVASKYPCTFIAGLDAHSPDEVVQPETYIAYTELINDCQITITPDISLRSLF